MNARRRNGGRQKQYPDTKLAPHQFTAIFPAEIQRTSASASPPVHHIDSGAQMISTDFPVTGLAARHGTDYTAELPGPGDEAVRCNPVNAPRACRTAWLANIGR
jgi:hypothetical protein